MGSLSVVGFHGGDRINVIPVESTFNIDRRLMPGEIAEDAVAQIAEVVRGVTGQAPDINTDGNSCTRLQKRLWRTRIEDGATTGATTGTTKSSD